MAVYGKVSNSPTPFVPDMKGVLMLNVQRQRDWLDNNHQRKPARPVEPFSYSALCFVSCVSSRPLQILPHSETILRHSTIAPASRAFQLGDNVGRLQPIRDRLSKTSDSVLRNRPPQVGRSAIVMPYRIVTSVKAAPVLKDACRGMLPKSGSRANNAKDDVMSAKPLRLQAVLDG